MKKLTQFALLLSLLLGFSSYSEASLLIEPVLGYNVGSKAEVETVQDYSGGGGPSFGGRIGYQNLGFQLGLDYLNSNIDMNDDDWDSNIKSSEWAGFIGYRFPVFFKVYAGFIFSATAESKYGGTEAELSEGSGTKLGVGFTGLPFIDLNVEYRAGKFEELKLGGAESDYETTYSSILLSVSLPITI